MKYRLPSNYSAKQLVHAYRHFKANPNDTWFPATDWTQDARPAAEWFRWFSGCMEMRLENKMQIAPDRPWDSILARLNRMQRGREVIRQTDLNGLPNRYKVRLQSLVSE